MRLSSSSQSIQPASFPEGVWEEFSLKHASQQHSASSGHAGAGGRIARGMTTTDGYTHSPCLIGFGVRDGIILGLHQLTNHAGDE